MKKILTMSLLAAALFVAGSAFAGDRWSISIGGGSIGGYYSSSGSYSFHLNGPGYYSYGSSYHCAPRYYSPPVYYCPPPQVYYYPAQQYYYPQYGPTIRYSSRPHCR